MGQVTNTTGVVFFGCFVAGAKCQLQVIHIENWTVRKQPKSGRSGAHERRAAFREAVRTLNGSFVGGVSPSQLSKPNL
jgi:hypothetical protein